MIWQSAPDNGRGVTAVLGPTNTGKTHLAIERMLAHRTGIVGLPLRLLAREVYGRMVEKAGKDAVALVTGEEKIRPSNARYHVCTVEAMPMDLSAEFAAIDEIQLAADLDRGHVFTDRLLHCRGDAETLLLGASTIRPLIERLLPGANIVTRPRFSTLSYSGDKKITRLPRRSAIVAFSASEVYAIAELVRRHRGGAAVVMGALSPRTRNAQVDLYQSGDVDFLIATDAIGMGLNLAVNHVAFASDRKFDGFQHRALTPAEFGQIAGRAGRYTTDGTFGVTGRTAPLENDMVERIEGHDFQHLEVLQWRNADLNFSSPEALRESLDETPRQAGLTRAPHGSDRLAFEAALADAQVRQTLGSKEDLGRLWSVCAVPDYRKIAPANHAELVISIYRHLTETGSIPEDWFGAQIRLCDRVDGDIDTISNRIAHVRTWTFAANRADWLGDPAYWRETTRAVEDRLSDALHERLTQRFVDRRTNVLMRRLQETERLEAYVTSSGELNVENHFVGRLKGLSFEPDGEAGSPSSKAVQSAAQRVLSRTLSERAHALVAAPDSAITLDADGRIIWLDAVVGRLGRSDDLLIPRVHLVADGQLDGSDRDKAQIRLQTWVEAHARTLLKPLFDLREAPGLSGIARGVAFRLVEGLGILPRPDVAADLRALEQPLRAQLRTHGARFGAHHVFLPDLLKPSPRALAARLHALSNDVATDRFPEVLGLLNSGRTSVPFNNSYSGALYSSIGYSVCGRMAVRIDILERLADLIRPLIAWRDGSGKPRPDGAEPGNAFTTTVAMTSLLGCAGDELASVLRALGYRGETRRRPAPKRANTPTSNAAREPDAIETVAEAATDTAGAVGRGGNARSGDNEHVPEPSETLQPDSIEVTGKQAAGSDASGDPRGEPGPTIAESGDARPEMVEVMVWRPGGTERRREKISHRGDSSQRGKTETGARQSPPKPQRPRDGRKAKAAKTSPPRSRTGKPPDRRPDPDSPFAALAALKDRMTSDT